MAVSSMTGFGRWESRVAGLTYSVEIRSVNHRYLEASLRLPSVLTAAEQKIRELLQTELSRGRVTVSVDISGADRAEEVRPDGKMIDTYLELAGHLKKKHGVPGEMDVNTLMRMPDLFVRLTPQLREEDVWPIIEKGMIRALAGLSQMRRREGRALAADLRQRLKAIRTALGRVEKMSAGRPEAATKELRRRLEKLLEGIPVNEDKIAQEAAHLGDRLDTTEEIVRARSHVDQFLRFMKEEGPVGRKLNFLLQELHREVNTIGSKANSAPIAREVVSLKEEVERLREQVQNLE